MTTADDYRDDYTEPELRAQLKEQIQAGEKGGRPGQWSARKAQLLTRAYEEAGGGYRHAGKRSEKQRHLEQWGDQRWHTADGSGDADRRGGMRRYLPDAAWKLLSPAERRATDAKKRRGTTQHVANTEAADHARAAAEVIDLRAGDAVAEVEQMGSTDELRRARTAESKLGKGRRTVLQAIDRRRRAL